MSPVGPTSDLDVTPAALSELLRELLGGRLSIDASDVLNRRAGYVVLQVTTRSPALDLLVKLAGPSAQDPRMFERTAHLHRLVRAQTAVPVPEVIAADGPQARWPWRYLVTAIVPGETLASVRARLDPADLAAVHRQLGDAVGQLHGISLPAFGEIEADANAACGAVVSSNTDEPGPASPPDAGPADRSWHAALVARARAWLPCPTLA